LVGRERWGKTSETERPEYCTGGRISTHHTHIGAYKRALVFLLRNAPAKITSPGYYACLFSCTFAHYIGTPRAPYRHLVGISPHTEVHVMLVLTRKASEKVIIDGCIAVEIVALDGNKVRLGITAPPQVRIDREEVHRARREFEDSGELVAAN
jgi:carbon storage regulator